MNFPSRLRAGMSPTVACVIFAVGWLTGRASAATDAIPESYNQWKEALTNAATPATGIQVPGGFQVDLVRSAQPGEGSWVAMTFDPQGRVVVAREDRGLLRMTLGTNGGVIRVETIHTNLLECRGLLFAHGALYVNANNSRGLYRLRDTRGGDRFDEVTLLKATPGGVGHGRNCLALGPDGMIYSIHGDDVGLPATGMDPSSPWRHGAEDRLLPASWDRHSANAGASMPYGHVVRTDPDGRRWEVMAAGLRNPFGLDFNAAGDLFTFDADMEWDVGLPWYHPCRVLHLVPGGDYGWRRGTGVLPVWAPDTLPSAVDIGLGSPTAVKFGTGSNWPEPWRSALLICDWSYGRILAVHLQPSGSSYSGWSEPLVSGRPLNVTGLEFSPAGDLYFVTGGRRTQAGLYRVRSLPAMGRPVPAGPGAVVATSRAMVADDAMSDDLWRRHAWRVALEARPVTEWSALALTHPSPVARLALARAGPASVQPALRDRLLAELEPEALPWRQLTVIRALAVSLARHDRPEPAWARRLCERWETIYPAPHAEVNQALCEILVSLGSDQVVPRTMPLLSRSVPQAEAMNYLFLLRQATNGWRLEDRRTYFAAWARGRREFRGANFLVTALNHIRADVESTMLPGERRELAGELRALDQVPVVIGASMSKRPVVREWTMADLAPALTPQALASDQRRLARAPQLFADAGCAQCHRFGVIGGLTGPDLSAVGRRFDARALLESLIEPSKVIADTYQSVTLTMRDGDTYDGRILAEDGDSVTLATHPLDPDQRRRVLKSGIRARQISQVSSMPAGLLNTLNRDEILDLVAWLLKGP